MWSPDETPFDLDPDASEAPYVALLIVTPVGEVRVMGELVEAGRRVHLVGAHVDGPGANRVSVQGLRVIVRAFAETFGVESLVIEGATRTTGARPGHTPLAVRWRRGAR
jgi:hypothetical protein